MSYVSPTGNANKQGLFVEDIKKNGSQRSNSSRPYGILEKIESRLGLVSPRLDKGNALANSGILSPDNKRASSVLSDRVYRDYKSEGEIMRLNEKVARLILNANQYKGD